MFCCFSCLLYHVLCSFRLCFSVQLSPSDEFLLRCREAVIKKEYETAQNIMQIGALVSERRKGRKDSGERGIAKPSRATAGREGSNVSVQQCEDGHCSNCPSPIGEGFSAFRLPDLFCCFSQESCDMLIGSSVPLLFFSADLPLRCSSCSCLSVSLFRLRKLRLGPM